MSSYLSYELRTYSGGTWRVDSIYDDLRIATYEAQRMHKSGRYSAVRLVEERYNHASGKFASKTVFRGTKADDANADAMNRIKRTRQREELRRPLPETGFAEIAYEDYDEPMGAGLVGLMLRLGLIVMGGFAALLGVHHFFGQL